MKTTLTIIMAFLLFSIFNCTGEKQSPLAGTWKPIISEFILADTITTESALELAGHAKIINKTHFATVFNGSTAEESFFNGGKYDITNDTYTEHIEYWLSDSTESNIGRSYTFESKIEGGQWTISGPIETSGDSLPPWKVHEVYKRID